MAFRNIWIGRTVTRLEVVSGSYCKLQQSEDVLAGLHVGAIICSCTNDKMHYLQLCLHGY